MSNGKSILIVDDSASMRQALRIALKSGDYDVTEAVDGLDAMSKLDGRKFHLIISDLNMPGMDGFALVTEAKAMPAYRFTPIMMLTTEVSDEKKQAGKAAGVRAWMPKPFQPNVLLEAVAKLIAL